MADGDMTIRAATLADYPKLRAVLIDTLTVHCQALPNIFRTTETPPPSWEFVTDLLSQGNGALLIAEQQECVVGFLTIRAVAVDHPYVILRRYGVIDHMGVLADLRRQGIGQALMVAAHEWARNQGLTQVRLNVWEFNREAIAFYEALGYTTTSRNMWTTI